MAKRGGKFTFGGSKAASRSPAVALGASVLDCPPVDGLPGWSAIVSCEPKAKGNSKVMVPIGKRCPRCKKPTRYLLASSNKDKKTEKAVSDLLRSVAPPAAIATDCVLHVSIRMPIRKSWSKKKKAKALAGTIRPTSAKKATGPIPDLGNLEKLIDDCLEAGGWVVNDSLIAQRRSEKIYHAEPGYKITLRELPSESE